MNVAVFGDSWTEGHGVDQPWTEFFPDNFYVTNNATSGNDNIKILESVKEYLELGLYPDYMIVGWSSIARRIKEYGDIGLHTYPEDYEHKKQADQDQKDHFDQFTIHELFNVWKEQIAEVEKMCADKNIKVMHFSVFGEQPRWEMDNFYGSFINMLAPEPFKFDLPMFEYDMSNDTNPMRSRYKEMFGDNWEYAVTERELLRETKDFISCGHPSKNGHIKLSKLILERLYDKT